VIGRGQPARRAWDERVVAQQHVAEQQMRHKPRAVDQRHGLVQHRQTALLAQRALQALPGRLTAGERAVDADRVVDVQAPAVLPRVVGRQLPADLEEPHVGHAGSHVAPAAARRQRSRDGERRAAGDRQRQPWPQAGALAQHRQRDRDRRVDQRRGVHLALQAAPAHHAAAMEARLHEPANENRAPVGTPPAVGGGSAGAIHAARGAHRTPGIKRGFRLSAHA